MPANDGYGAIASRMEALGIRGWDFWVQQRRVGMHIISKWNEDAARRSYRGIRFRPANGLTCW
ncbi:MAG: hypothetical protein R3B96_12100 [Pirellulaceae bacterium]